MCATSSIVIDSRQAAPPASIAINRSNPAAHTLGRASFCKLICKGSPFGAGLFHSNGTDKVNSLPEAEVFVSVSGGDLPANGGQFSGDNQFSSITSSRIEL